MSTPLLSFIGIQAASVLTAAFLLHAYRKTHKERMQMLSAIGCNARASRERGYVFVLFSYAVLTVVIGVISALFFLPSA